MKPELGPPRSQAEVHSRGRLTQGPVHGRGYPTENENSYQRRARVRRRPKESEDPC